MLDRLRAALQAYRAPYTPKPEMPPLGEVAIADARRLFPAGWYTPFNPSVLVTRQGLGIFDLMRQDDMVKAALGLKKHAILATGWTVTSPEGQPRDWEVTRFVRVVLDRMPGTLDDRLLEILTALDYGYSVTELIWEVIPDGEFAGLIGLQLKTRRPHAFDFDQDPYGNLLPDGVLQRQPGALRRLPASKFIVFSYDAEFSNLYGRSDLEAAYRHWWAKDNALKWLAMLLERLGIPPMFGLYDPTKYSKEQVTELKKVIRDLQAATAGLLPRVGGQQTLELWAPELAGQATRVFIPAIEYYDRAIARALLMPGLIGVTPDAEEGSFARARVHFDVFMLVVERLRRQIRERVMEEQIVRPLVRWNFPTSQVPVWDWLPLTETVRLDLLDRWLQFVQAGAVRQQPDDERHIREMLRFPELQSPAEVATLERLEARAREEIADALAAAHERTARVIERAWPLSRSSAEQYEVRGLGAVQSVLQEALRQAYALGTGGDVPSGALEWLRARAADCAAAVSRPVRESVRRVLVEAAQSGADKSTVLRQLRELTTDAPVDQIWLALAEAFARGRRGVH